MENLFLRLMAIGTTEPDGFLEKLGNGHIGFFKLNEELQMSQLLDKVDTLLGPSSKGQAPPLGIIAIRSQF